MIKTIVLVVTFLAGINSSFAASQCYEIKRKVCNWELAHAGNGKEYRQSISDRYSCELNEQQYSEKQFKIHDEQRNTFNSSEIDSKIKFYQDEISSYKSKGLSTDRDELELCFWQEKKNYYQQGSKANTPSNQTSSSQPAPPSENNQPSTQSTTYTTTSKKGKKNPNTVPAHCVGFNHDKTKIVNKCNFPLNFSYCMMHQDDQNIQVANSCNDGFVNEAIYPGRAISDESLDTRFFAIACKFPSKPINMKYISFNVPVEGNCSR